MAGLSSSACGVCLENVWDARLLTCFHSFCKSCLDDMDMRTGHDHQIACPICRSKSRLPDSGASGLPKDFTRAVERVYECHTCRQQGEAGQPEVSCTTCDLAFCKDHGFQHILSESEHHVKAVNLSKNPSPMQGPAYNRKCDAHGLHLRYYCKQCDTAVCGDCTALGEHHGHKPIVPMKELAKDLQRRVRCKTDDLRNARLPALQKALSTVDDVSSELSSRADQIRAEIRAAGKRAVHNVELSMQQKLTEVDDLQEGRLKLLHSQQDELQQHMDMLRSVLRFSENVCEADAEAERVCDHLFAIDRQADQLDNTRLEEEPIQHARLDFRSVNEDELLVKASELMGTVLSCEACAAHTTIKAEGKNLYIDNWPVSFVVVAKDSTGHPLSNGGDVIEAQWCQLPQGVIGLGPRVDVLDYNNGTYQITFIPQHLGNYSFNVSINKVKIRQSVSITCSPRHLTFDPNECQEDTTIRAGHLTMEHTGQRRRYSSALGSVGMTTSQHIWKVKLSARDGMNIYLGVAVKSGLTARECNNYNWTFSWYGFNRCKKLMGQVTETGMHPWENGDILQLNLDCDKHTLWLTNTRTGEMNRITVPPNEELFAYFSTYWRGDSLTLIPS